MNTLPDEVILSIIHHLYVYDIGQFSLTCKHLNAVCCDEAFWSQRAQSLDMSKAVFTSLKSEYPNPICRYTYVVKLYNYPLDHICRAAETDNIDVFTYLHKRIEDEHTKQQHDLQFATTSYNYHALLTIDSVIAPDTWDYYRTKYENRRQELKNKYDEAQKVAIKHASCRILRYLFQYERYRLNMHHVNLAIKTHNCSVIQLLLEFFNLDYIREKAMNYGYSDIIDLITANQK